MALRSVLFDLDGVLVDTEGVYTDFWSAVDRRFPTGVDNFALKIKGSTLSGTLDTYFDPAQHPAILEMLKSQESGMEYRLFDGAERLLRDLRAEGVRTAIVTSSNRPKMDVVFSQLPILKELTDRLVTDEDVTESKPSPQAYLVAASRLGVAPGECVVVEDSVNGLRAGRASGAAVVGVATTNSADAIAGLADVIVDSAGDITVAMLRSLADDRFRE